MLVDSLSLLPGSEFSHLVVATGSSLPPANNQEGQLFYLNSNDAQEGLYVFKNANWVQVGGSAGGATTISSLSDVQLTNAVNGQILIMQNGKFVNAAIPAQALANLSDTTIGVAADKQVLRYDAPSSKWVPSAEQTLIKNLSELSDVVIDNPTDGMIMQFSSGKWRNVVFPESSLSDLADVASLTPQTNSVLTYSGTEWVTDTVDQLISKELSYVNLAASRAALATDAFKQLNSTSSTDITYTINDDSVLNFAVGTVILIMALGAGLVTVVGAGNASVFSKGAPTTSVQYDTIVVEKVGANSWSVSGGVLV